MPNSGDQFGAGRGALAHQLESIDPVQSIAGELAVTDGKIGLSGVGSLRRNKLTNIDAPSQAIHLLSKYNELSPGSRQIAITTTPGTLSFSHLSIA